MTSTASNPCGLAKIAKSRTELTAVYINSASATQALITGILCTPSKSYPWLKRPLHPLWPHHFLTLPVPATILLLTALCNQQNSITFHFSPSFELEIATPLTLSRAVVGRSFHIPGIFGASKWLQRVECCASCFCQSLFSVLWLMPIT